MNTPTTSCTQSEDRSQKGTRNTYRLNQGQLIDHGNSEHRICWGEETVSCHGAGSPGWLEIGWDSEGATISEALTLNDVIARLGEQDELIAWATSEHNQRQMAAA